MLSAEQIHEAICDWFDFAHEDAAVAWDGPTLTVRLSNEALGHVHLICGWLKVCSRRVGLKTMVYGEDLELAVLIQEWSGIVMRSGIKIGEVEPADPANWPAEGF
jgi:hypothetical protein